MKAERKLFVIRWDGIPLMLLDDNVYEITSWHWVNSIRKLPLDNSDRAMYIYYKQKKFLVNVGDHFLMWSDETYPDDLNYLPEYGK